MGNLKKPPSLLKRLRYVLIGMIGGIILIIGGGLTLYLLPVALPIIGITLVALSVQLELIASIFLMLGSLAIAGIIGGGLGKLFELFANGEKNMLRVQLNFRDAVKPLAGFVTGFIATVVGKFRFSKALEGHAVELQRFDPDDTDSVESVDDFTPLSEPIDKTEWITLKILEEISGIKKESGWIKKVKTLRDKFLVGHENTILDELQKHEKELKIKFICKILSLESSKMKEIFDDFFILKLKVLFHPDLSLADPSVTNTELNDKVAREFSGWFDKVVDQLKHPDELAEMFQDQQDSQILNLLRKQNNVLAQILVILTDTNQRLKSMAKRMEKTIAVANSKMKEAEDFLSEAKPQIKQMKKDTQKLRQDSQQVIEGMQTLSKDMERQDSMLVEFAERLEKLNSDTSWDELEKRFELMIQERMRESSPTVQEFSRTLSLPRLAAPRQGIFFRRAATQQSARPPLLLKNREEADKENSRPRATVN